MHGTGHPKWSPASLRQEVVYDSAKPAAQLFRLLYLWGCVKQPAATVIGPPLQGNISCARVTYSILFQDSHQMTGLSASITGPFCLRAVAPNEPP